MHVYANTVCTVGYTSGSEDTPPDDEYMGKVLLFYIEGRAGEYSKSKAKQEEESRDTMR